MREIKFRAKTAYETPALLKGAWVYGSYVYNLPKNSHKIIDPEGVSFEVDPETVGQFTGFMDSRGFEIYEGSIVRQTDGISLKDIFAEVVFVEGKWAARSTIGDHKICTHLSWGIETFDPNCFWSIVGNIYEHSTLLSQ